MAVSPASGAPLHGTLLFHLNLCYSSIEEEERGDVVRRAYRPLLGLLEELPWLRLAVEAPGHTLEMLGELDPEWLEQLRSRMEQGRVEFVGSGDTQLIGPLVPAAVNRMNQRLGRETYRSLLASEPRVALVNELAWSQGLVDAYLDADYQAVLMEWNNPRRSHPEWDDEWRYRPVWTCSPGGRRLPVLWTDAIAFQKFQRVVSGELEVERYVEWVASQATDRPRHLFLYSNDAEIFDYRVGRFAAEPALEERGEGEWERMARVLTELRSAGVSFTTPSALLDDPAFQPEVELELSHIADPIPVKKQPKYNVTRWALTGRDDVGLNTRAFARARLLQEGQDPEAWRQLCRSWSSDQRTHLTSRRWNKLRSQQEPFPDLPWEERGDPPRASEVRIHRSAERMTVETGGVQLKLNLRRGLAIESLAFRESGSEPLVGTLGHGYFDHIDWAADFYSGHTVCEMPSDRRVTDLARVEPRIDPGPNRVEIVGDIPTPLGTLVKKLRVFRDSVTLEFKLSGWGERPACSLRTGILTLLPEAFGPSLSVTAANGGEPERFPVAEPCDQGASVSALITAGAAFGATDGRLQLDDGKLALDLSWPNFRAAALPLFTFQRVAGKRFVRIAFSLSEIDETHRPGAPLYDFQLSLRGRRISP